MFFDIGNVLFNDDPQSFLTFRRYYEALRDVRPGYTFADMLAERESLASEGSIWILYDLAQRTLGVDRMRDLNYQIRAELLPRYDDVHLVNPNLDDTLATLRERYRLGIIANQPPESRKSLARRNLLQFFDVVAISEELDLHKPDPALFEWALQKAGISPEQTLMVGDRRDNDILPAVKLGMKTIWLHWPSSAAKNWNPTDKDARAFLASCDRVPLFHSPAHASIVADQTIHSIPATIAALDTIVS
ncbi:MAG: HAD family hydrolase [Planctomycetota bacterium]